MCCRALALAAATARLQAAALCLAPPECIMPCNQPLGSDSDSGSCPSGPVPVPVLVPQGVYLRTGQGRPAASPVLLEALGRLLHRDVALQHLDQPVAVVELGVLGQQVVQDDLRVQARAACARAGG